MDQFSHMPIMTIYQYTNTHTQQMAKIVIRCGSDYKAMQTLFTFV